MEPVIFHVDVNSAFLSWEAVYRLRELGETEDLRKLVCAVGGDSSKRRGIILAKSMGAKAFGVRTGESILEARKKCPQLLLVPARYGLYRRFSDAFMAILREYSPEVEPYSIDEAFVDMSGMERLYGPPVEAANTIRERIWQELGFTVNIGISTNRLLAKMASDFKKPNLVHTLFPDEIADKMWPLPVGELFFVGRATERRLADMGIRTIGELARMDRRLMVSHLGRHGEVIWDFANGKASALVESEQSDAKGYGNSTTVAFDVTDSETARLVLLSLCETVGARLRNHGVRAETVAVTLKNTELKSRVHQMALGAPTNITEELYQASCRLFNELWEGEALRLLGVSTGKIREEQSRQISIFDGTDYEKLERLDRAVDQIRGRFGVDSIKRAAFLSKPGKDGENVEHMSGRLIRERRELERKPEKKFGENRGREYPEELE